MKYLSVCSGIEAATCAWHPLGWEPVGFSEIEKFPSAVLAHHYPNVPNLGDMTKFKEWDIARPDLIVGGTPCQSFSVAGLRKGLADPRGNLALVYLAMADFYRPEWLVWENVPGVLSSNGGRDFGAFLGGLAELGYGFAYRVLDAQFFGVAQRRRRVFVVANLGDWRRAAAVLFERQSLSGNPAPRRETGERPSPTIGARPSSSGGQADTDGGVIVSSLDASFARLQGCSGQDMNHGHSHLVAFGGNNTAGPIDVATARNACASASGRLDFESETFVTHTLRADGFDASEDGPGRGTPLVPVSVALRGREGGATAELGDEVAFTLRASEGGGDKPHVMLPVAFDTTQITSPANYSNPQPGDPCHPLAAGAHPPAVAFDCKASGQSGFGVGEIASTMRAMGHAGSHQNGGGHQAVAVGMAVRRLTPSECERLQGFPDDYTDIRPRGKDTPDGPRYKALGNSMAVPCMAWIGERIQQVSVQNELERAA